MKRTQTKDVAQIMKIQPFDQGLPDFSSIAGRVDRCAGMGTLILWSRFTKFEYVCGLLLAFINFITVWILDCSEGLTIQPFPESPPASNTDLPRGFPRPVQSELGCWL
jgi:hypothetical protein